MRKKVYNRRRKDIIEEYPVASKDKILRFVNRVHQVGKYILTELLNLVIQYKHNPPLGDVNIVNPEQ